MTEIQKQQQQQQQHDGVRSPRKASTVHRRRQTLLETQLRALQEADEQQTALRSSKRISIQGIVEDVIEESSILSKDHVKEEVELIRRVSKTACLKALQEHLINFQQEFPNGTYEEWVAELAQLDLSLEDESEQEDFWMTHNRNNDDETWIDVRQLTSGQLRRQSLMQTQQRAMERAHKRKMRIFKRKVKNSVQTARRVLDKWKPTALSTLASLVGSLEEHPEISRELQSVQEPDEAELESIRLEAHRACMEAVEIHLDSFLQEHPDANYEEWIRDLHPENTSNDDSIDHRFYLEESDHRVLWNHNVIYNNNSERGTVDSTRSVAPVRIPSA